jgi:hypothetical protein
MSIILNLFSHLQKIAEKKKEREKKQNRVKFIVKGEGL